MKGLFFFYFLASALLFVVTLANNAANHTIPISLKLDNVSTSIMKEGLSIFLSTPAPTSMETIYHVDLVLKLSESGDHGIRSEEYFKNISMLVSSRALFVCEVSTEVLMNALKALYQEQPNSTGDNTFSIHTNVPLDVARLLF